MDGGFLQEPALFRRGVSVGGQSFRVRASEGRRTFWERVAAGQWEPQTFRAFDRFLDERHSCIDIGAWIGPTVLYAAGLARRVHALEPDPDAFDELLANVAANPWRARRITLHPQGVADRCGTQPLYAGGLYFDGANRFGDSMSGLLPAGVPGQPSREVDTVVLHEWMEAHAITDCNFIKMDIEGGEYGVIPGLWRRLRAWGMPALHVSFHAPEAARREQLIAPCLEELMLCYRHFRAGDQPLDLRRALAAVRDWADEDPGSAWRELECGLGQGLVASNEER